MLKPKNRLGLEIFLEGIERFASLKNCKTLKFDFDKVTYYYYYNQVHFICWRAFSSTPYSLKLRTHMHKWKVGRRLFEIFIKRSHLYRWGRHTLGDDDPIIERENGVVHLPFSIKTRFPSSFSVRITPPFPLLGSVTRINWNISGSRQQGNVWKYIQKKVQLAGFATRKQKRESQVQSVAKPFDDKKCYKIGSMRMNEKSLQNRLDQSR